MSFGLWVEDRRQRTGKDRGQGTPRLNFPGGAPVK